MSEFDAASKDWMVHALCFTDKEIKPKIFSPPKGSSGSEAKKVCDICPVKVDCLEYAIANHENENIWGGKTPTERKRMLRNTFVRPFANLGPRPRYIF